MYCERVAALITVDVAGDFATTVEEEEARAPVGNSCSVELDCSTSQRPAQLVHSMKRAKSLGM